MLNLLPHILRIPQMYQPRPYYLGIIGSHFLLQFRKIAEPFFCWEYDGCGQRILGFPEVGWVCGHSDQSHSLNNPKSFQSHSLVPPEKIQLLIIFEFSHRTGLFLYEGIVWFWAFVVHAKRGICHHLFREFHSYRSEPGYLAGKYCQAIIFFGACYQCQCRFLPSGLLVIHYLAKLPNCVTFCF